MILCKRAEGTDGYFVQAEGSTAEVTVEVLHIIRAVYDNSGSAAEKNKIRKIITGAVTGIPGENIWDAQAEATSINLSTLHRQTEGEGEQRPTGKN